MTGIKWKIGDKLRILDAGRISGGYFMKESENYVVVKVNRDKTPIVYLPDIESYMCFSIEEMRYVEIVLECGVL